MLAHDSAEASLVAVATAVGLIAALLTIAIVVEAIADALTGRRRDWRETASNLMVGIPNQVLTATVVGSLVVAGLTLMSQLTPLSLGYGPLVWVGGFIAVDFVYYWSHRLEHRVSILWGHHSVHHSSTSFDLSTSVRIAWHDGLMAVVYLAPLALLGFPPMMLLVLFEAGLVYQTWVHTQRIKRVPFIEGILNTPAAHRVHHASNAMFIDKNHGGVFMMWDRLFGTWADESELTELNRVRGSNEEIRFGLTVPPPGINPLRVNFSHYVHMLGVAREARSVGDVVLAIFGPPEWTPQDGFGHTDPKSWWHRWNEVK
jgi:sterol desaturase/sphingolipid hydroxylase (fatty acid hydroxylase superfamily)